MSDIYIAGPLFTRGEREILEQIDTICKKAGYTTSLPHRDAGLFTREEKSSEKFFSNDLEKLKEAKYIVAVLNGIGVDSGTSWEMGYAFAHNKPIIGYVEDTRIYNPKLQLNPMIINSLDQLVNSLAELESLLTTYNGTNN